MSAYRIHLIALLISTTAFGCKTNSNYCPGANPNNNCAEIDAAPSRCSGSADCSAPTGVCKLDTGTCVQCTDNGTCTDMAPICGNDNKCRGCAAHSECASSVCRPDGRCSAESSTNEVAYVAPAPTGSGNTCTKFAPCASISTALDTKRPYIKITGQISDNPKVEGAQTVTLLADPGAKLTPKANGILLELKGSSNLTIYDLELSGALGSAGDGIYMPADNQSTLSLYRVKILNNTRAGINADGGTLNISQSTISGNDGGGILMSLDSITTFEIRNNFIVRNGAVGGPPVGGVRLKPALASNSKLEFNTIVGNMAGSGIASTGGVYCDVPAFVIANNIIIQNSGGSSGTAQTFGVCEFGQSLTTTPGGGAGAGFRSEIDFHLTASTPDAIRDKVDCNGKDIDGDDRPQGDRCDLGADEYRP